MTTAVNVGLTEVRDILQGSCEGCVVGLALHPVDEALCCEAVHDPGDEVALEAAAATVVKLELVWREGASLDAATACTTSEVEWVVCWIGNLNPRSISAESGIWIEDLRLEDSG